VELFRHLPLLAMPLPFMAVWLRRSTEPGQWLAGRIRLAPGIVGLGVKKIVEETVSYVQVISEYECSRPKSISRLLPVSIVEHAGEQHNRLY